jgi:hypothetical protein
MSHEKSIDTPPIFHWSRFHNQCNQNKSYKCLYQAYGHHKENTM